MVFFYTPREDGYVIYVGRDKHENEELLKYGWNKDVWFHVDKVRAAVFSGCCDCRMSIAVCRLPYAACRMPNAGGKARAEEEGNLAAAPLCTTRASIKGEGGRI